MFNPFKKKNLQTANETVQDSSCIIPSANYALEKSSKNWRYVTRKEVASEITYACSKGRKHITFFDSYISKELQDELIALGYKVNVEEVRENSGPLFKIAW